MSTREGPGYAAPGLTQSVTLNSDTPRLPRLTDGDREGWLPAYLNRRERVLGQRLTLSKDPGIAAEQLAEQHGGRARALAWLDQVEAVLR